MLVYGLTGGIGSGKSAVATLLEDYGIPCVSADELSRMVVAPGSSGLGAVVEAFGPEVLADDGSLDRKAMAGQIFADAGKRKKLESILHPKIRESFQHVLAALGDAGHAVVVYEVPLLFEKGHEKDLHAVILVTAEDRVRIARVQARDDMSEDEVLARMKTQMPEDEKRTRADYVIDNEGSLDDLRREVQLMLPRFLKVRNASHLQLLPQAMNPQGTPITEIQTDAPPSAENTVVGEAPDALPSQMQTSIGTSAPPPAPPQSAQATVVGPAPAEPGAPSTLDTSAGFDPQRRPDGRWQTAPGVPPRQASSRASARSRRPAPTPAPPGAPPPSRPPGPHPRAATAQNAAIVPPSGPAVAPAPSAPAPLPPPPVAAPRVPAPPVATPSAPMPPLPGSSKPKPGDS